MLIQIMQPVHRNGELCGENMRDKKLIAAICCLFLWLNMSVSAQRDDLLDLTKERGKVTTSRGESRSGSIGGVTHQNSRPATPPLRFSLVSLDKQQYELSERFVYEISIENIGNQPFLLPWEPDKGKIEPKSPSTQAGLRRMSLFLVIEELNGNAVFGAQDIYGSDSVSRSLKKLNPGHKVRVRVPGGWYLGSEDMYKRVLPLLPRSFNVKAKLRLVDHTKSDIEQYEPLISNSWPVELRKRT